MNEFTIFNGTIWFSDTDSVYKHLYPEHGFEVESLGVSDRFVSEDAFIAQRNLKDEYMRRDQKHSETISELRKELKEKQDYIKIIEKRINEQKETINKIYGSMAAENITDSLRNWKHENLQYENKVLCAAIEEATTVINKLNEKVSNQKKELANLEELQNENKVLKARLKDDIGIEYTDSTDYISQLHKNVLNQRKELANLNKVLERERKRNKELEELYSNAQRDVSMLNLKVMELNEGIHNSDDLTWKEKYDRLKETHNDLREKYTNELRKRLKQRDDKIETLETGIKELSTANDDLHGIRDSADLTWKEKYDKLAKECEMYRRIALRNKKENHDKDVAFSKIVNIIDETVTKKEE